MFQADDETPAFLLEAGAAEEIASGGVPSDTEDDVVELPANWKRLKHDELAQLAEDIGIESDGTKKELISRIEAEVE